MMTKEKILESIMSILENIGELGGDISIDELTLALYEENVKQFRPIVKAMPALAERVGQDLNPVIEGFFRLILSIKRNEKTNLLASDLSREMAKSRMNTLSIHMEQGFTRDEAFTLLLNSEFQVKQLMQTLKKGGKS